MMRDEKMLQFIKNYMPDRKVSILELGSGRGGLSRYLTRELIKEDKLELYVATNISEIENNYNKKRASEEGIPDDKFRVDYGSFDDIQYDTESFDIVFSNEAFLHSQNKEKLMLEVARLVKQNGCCIISDILESPTVEKAKLTEVYGRLDLKSMGNHEMYEAKLTEAGMTKLFKEVSAESIIKHYGMVLYSATELKREELLGPNGVTQEFLD